jgi:hypothetical protein
MQQTKSQSDDKSIALVKEQATKAIDAVKNTKIKTDEDLGVATDIIVKVAKVGKMIKAEEKKQLDPAKATLAAIKDFWRPFIEANTLARQVLEKEILDYRAKIAAKNEAKREKIVDKVSAGDTSFDKGAQQIEKVQDVQKTIHTDEGKTMTRKHKVVEIVDESKLPREYLKPDVVKINAAAKGGVEIPGVVVTEKEILAVG